MDNYEFNVLPLKEQITYTKAHGTFLAARPDKDHVIQLFHLEKFFVEMWYNSESGKFDKVRSFKSRKCLEPYLEDISLNI